MNNLNDICTTLHDAEIGAYVDYDETKLRVCDGDDRAWPIIKLHPDGQPYLQICAARKRVKYATLLKIGDRVLQEIQKAGVAIDRYSVIRYGY